MVSLVGANGTRRPPSQQLSFHSSKNHSRNQSASVPPSTPRNACQMTEIEAPCIRKFTVMRDLSSIGNFFVKYTLYKIRIALLRQEVMEVNISFAKFRIIFFSIYMTQLSRDSVNIAFYTVFIAALLLDGSELLK